MASPTDNPPTLEPANAPIEVDQAQQEDDADSALGSDSESYTTSLKSSVLNYRYENGRRYHAVGESYFLPNDESELDRLDLYHHICTLRMGGELHLAPLGSEPQRILDIGTGTGIWAIEIADMYPSAEVIGNDISPVQPKFVPPNVSFEVDDVEQEWAYSRPFDYIHCRYMAGSIRDWPRLMQQAFNFTKPGGWVEFHDFDMRWYTHRGIFRPGSPLDEWCSGIIDGIKGLGLDPEPGPKLEGWVRDAGFVKVKHLLLPIPTGTWPKDKKLKEIGAYDMVQFLDGMDSISMRVFMTLKGYTKEEVTVMLANLRTELKNPKMQIQHNFHVVYGQKPGGPSAED